ncbi:hypothetical protein [Lysinibacillus piscis]|uniref:DUF1430 domain-containing protein n=1 Tax=Lysinibacillus piscis TaxID=2518931 RepID=A0ABQ5NM68_9BACI|nr:hypothetical protein [Lysinibacillus sp. KH24]GLC89196.1 hypothetical protein LYSBPC_23230 [Lysinibacillus sp. KH24]
MKKLLFIFLIGQLLLLSYIFNQSVYQIYELNNIGDSSLDMYMVNDATSEKLKKLYQIYNDNCLIDNKCKIQLVKTPVSENQKMFYEIYHSQIETIQTPASIRTNNIFHYLPLKEEDFVDSNGIFYTNLSIKEITEFGKQTQLDIQPYNNLINYKEIITFNLFNFIVFLVISQLILFIYTFTKIKTNAIKKVLGYSGLKIIFNSFKSFFFMEISILLSTFFIHFIYYWITNNIVWRYFYFLFLFLVIVILINMMMFMFTQISLKFIDIPTMIKNKIYSNKLNYGLYTVKILLILVITVSTSIFIADYKDYKAKVAKLSEYEKLDHYFTAIGFNSDEFEKINNEKKLLKQYGDYIKNLYEHFDNLEELYVFDASDLIGSLSSFWLEMKGKSKEDIYSDWENNYIIVNKRYLEDLTTIKINNNVEPTILVPTVYKTKESKIKETYIEKYNNLLNYDEIYQFDDFKPKKITNINIIYIEDHLNIELFGKNIDDDGSKINLQNPIIILDQGNFGSQYYYTQLNQGDIIFKLRDKQDFSQALAKFHLSQLVNTGSLLTPFMTAIHNAEFFMYNSLIFTLLFLLTLIFIICISNYIDLISNSKKYVIQYIFGLGMIKIFKANIVIYIVLLSVVFIDFYWDFNILFYLSILLADFLILLTLYTLIIKRDVHKLIKGG